MVLIFSFDKNYRDNYKKITDFFQAREVGLQALRIIYRFAPMVVAAGYFVCLLISIKIGTKLFLSNLAAPVCCFVIVSVLRCVADFPRPYEKESIHPLIPKTKKGHSFPSRHAASAAVIAMAWWNLDVRIGICCLILAAFVAVSRVLAGVHYMRDVVAGLMFGIFVGGIPLFF